uniref:Uncharacterized protein n=1 Tax=Arion vulgaris TaxID=1028688 RepID=A0A0B7BRV1_9EUPU
MCCLYLRENSSATGELSTNFRAEQQAIVDASKILQQRNIQNNKLVFLCDCLSVLQATQKEPQDKQSTIWVNYEKLQLTCSFIEATHLMVKTSIRN